MGLKKEITLGTALLCYFPCAFAVDLTFTAGAELEWTDNAFLTESDREDDLIETIRLGVAAEETDSLYQLRLAYQAEHQRYEQESFDAETYYNGSGSLLLTPIQDRFDWLFSVESTTTQTNSVLPDTPDNRDQRTVYRTSPSLRILSLSRDTLTLSGDASKVEFREEDESDSDRAGGSVDWQHLLSQLTSTNVVLGYEKANFEIEQDYAREYYTIGFTRQINGGSASLSAGQTRIKPEDDEESDGVNFAATVNWTKNAHALFFEARQDLTDTTVGLLDATEGSQDYLSPTEVNTGQVDLVTRTIVIISDTYTFNSTTSLMGSLYGDQEETETEENESTRVGASVFFRRSLTPEVDATAEYRYEVAEEGLLEIEERTENINLGLDKRFGEDLSLRFWLEREASDSDLDGLDYEVHLIGATVTATF